MSAQNQYIDAKGHMAESTMRIKDLAQAEKVYTLFHRVRVSILTLFLLKRN